MSVFNRKVGNVLFLPIIVEVEILLLQSFQRLAMRIADNDGHIHQSALYANGVGILRNIRLAGEFDFIVFALVGRRRGCLPLQEGDGREAEEHNDESFRNTHQRIWKSGYRWSCTTSITVCNSTIQFVVNQEDL